jgi:hypothetical protein
LWNSVVLFKTGKKHGKHSGKSSPRCCLIYNPGADVARAQGQAPIGGYDGYAPLVAKAMQAFKTKEVPAPRCPNAHSHTMSSRVTHTRAHHHHIHTHPPVCPPTHPPTPMLSTAAAGHSLRQPWHGGGLQCRGGGGPQVPVPPAETLEILAFMEVRTALDPRAPLSWWAVVGPL